MTWQEKLKDLIINNGKGMGKSQVKVISVKDLDLIFAKAEKEWHVIVKQRIDKTIKSKEYGDFLDTGISIGNRDSFYDLQKILKEASK